MSRTLADVISIITGENLAFQIGTSPYEPSKSPHSYFAHVSTNYNTLARNYAEDTGRAFCSVDADLAETLFDAYQRYLYCLSQQETKKFIEDEHRAAQLEERIENGM